MVTAKKHPTHNNLCESRTKTVDCIPRTLPARTVENPLILLFMDDWITELANAYLRRR